MKTRWSALGTVMVLGGILGLGAGIGVSFGWAVAPVEAVGGETIGNVRVPLFPEWRAARRSGPSVTLDRFGCA